MKKRKEKKRKTKLQNHYLLDCGRQIYYTGFCFFVNYKKVFVHLVSRDSFSF